MPGRFTLCKIIARALAVGLAFASAQLPGTTPLALAQTGIPTDRLLESLRPSADVNDYAGVLSPQEKATLEARCKQLREKTGAELAVVVVQSLEGGQIDDFANKLFSRWGIGKQGKDNGVLLLVAIGDRKARIEVGYGLEPILPDALAGRVLDEQLFPAFRQQKYSAGLTAAGQRIATIVERNEPAPANLAERGAKKQTASDIFMALVFLSLFVAVGSFVAGFSMGSRTAQPILFGLFFAGVAMFIGCTLAFPWAPLVHGPLALIVGWLGWQTGRSNRGRRRRSGSGWIGPSADSWTWGASGGGSNWSGGGFSGGSWGGFGGGSSGGGGASGGW
jgi:uncharacterized protein